MSKKCADCGCEVNRNVIQGMYYCPRCDDDKSERDVLPLILFDRLTASPEVLAEKLVYCHIAGWTSYLMSYHTLDREEAIAATVAKLKEVE